MIALGTRGEPVRWAALETWGGLLYAAGIASVFALVPSLLVAGLLGAAFLRRSLNARGASEVLDER